MSYRYTIETENPIVIDGNKMFNCNDGKLRLRIVEANPWHTGTPTEEGWYLVVLPICEQVYRYESDYFNKAGKWRLYTNQVIAWRKIEPFEETD